MGRVILFIVKDTMSHYRVRIFYLGNIGHEEWGPRLEDSYK